MLVLASTEVCEVRRVDSRDYPARADFFGILATEPDGTGRALVGLMAKRVEDLICWQLADSLRQMIIKHTADGTPAGKDFRFTANFREAISSVCRNQSEGFAKFYHRPQKPYFNTARSSLAEVKDCIRDGMLRGHFSEELAKEMDALCARATTANLRYLKSLDRPDPKPSAST